MLTYPYIDFCADIVTTIFVNHLRRSVHHSRVLLIPFKRLVDCIFCQTLMLESGRACWSEVTKLKLLVVQKDILDLDVSVCNRWVLIVHMKDASADVAKDVHNLLFTQTFAAEFNQQVEQGAIWA